MEQQQVEAQVVRYAQVMQHAVGVIIQRLSVIKDIIKMAVDAPSARHLQQQRLLVRTIYLSAISQKALIQILLVNML